MVRRQETSPEDDQKNVVEVRVIRVVNVGRVQKPRQARAKVDEATRKQAWGQNQEDRQNYCKNSGHLWTQGTR